MRQNNIAFKLELGLFYYGRFVVYVTGGRVVAAFRLNNQFLRYSIDYLSPSLVFDKLYALGGRIAVAEKLPKPLNNATSTTRKALPLKQTS